MTTVNRCPTCNTIILRAGKCPTCDANKREFALTAQTNRCFFQPEGKCRGKVNIRINDSWLCTWHYEHFYDHRIRHGEKIPAQELRFKSHLENLKEDLTKLRKTVVGSVRDLCIGWMKKEGIYSAVPKHLREQAEREALEERRAIQEEA